MNERSLSIIRYLLCAFWLIMLTVLSTRVTYAGSTWTGAVNTEWNNASNWTGGIPTSGSDVSISSTANQPVISAASGTVSGRDITINTGATLTQTGGVLQVYRDWVNYGTFAASGGTVNFKGSGTPSAVWASATSNQFYHVIIDNGVNPRFDIAPNGVLSVAGNWTDNNIGALGVANAYTVTFNGSGAQTITTSRAANNSFYNLAVNKSGGTLSLTSDLNTNSNFIMTAGIFDPGTYLMTIGGTFSSFAGGTIRVGSSTFAGNYSQSPSTPLTAGTTVDYYASGATVFQSLAYSNLKISGSGTKTLGGATTVNAGLTVSGSATLGLSTFALGTPTSMQLENGAAGSSITGTGTLTLGGPVNVTYVAAGNNGASIACPVALGSSTRTFTVQDETSPATDLTMSGTITGTGGLTKAGAGTLSFVSQDITMLSLTIDGGTLISTTRPLTLTGNFTNNATFTHNSSTVTFNGTTQTIGGTSSTVFNHVTINGGGVKTLGNDESIAGTLTLSSGVISTTSSYVLSLLAGAGVTGASSSSFVEGRVKKIGNTGFVFPVGKSGTGYQPIEISAPADPSDAFTAEYTRTSARSFGASTTSPLRRVSDCEYWQLDRTTGTSAVDVTLYGNANSGCGPLTPAEYFTGYSSLLSDLRVARWNGSTWENATSGSTSYTGTSPNITVTAPAVSTFSPISFGSDGDNPLPVELVSFTANLKQAIVSLKWKTATEKNNDGFGIERSYDLQSWKEVAFVPGHGTVNTPRSYSYEDRLMASDLSHGTLSYRLKQIDRDGRFEYSPVVSVSNQVAPALAILPSYPNPVRERMSMVSFSLPQDASVTVRLFNTMGQEVRSVFGGWLPQGVHTQQVYTDDLPKGLYHYVISDGLTQVTGIILLTR